MSAFVRLLDRKPTGWLLVVRSRESRHQNNTQEVLKPPSYAGGIDEYITRMTGLRLEVSGTLVIKYTQNPPPISDCMTTTLCRSILAFLRW